jgi:hypothetical protein
MCWLWMARLIFEESTPRIQAASLIVWKPDRSARDRLVLIVIWSFRARDDFTEILMISALMRARKAESGVAEAG